MTEKFTLDYLVTKTQELIDDHKYSVSRVKQPAKKRAEENALSFWTAINDHLVTYKSLLKDSTIS